MRGTLPALTLGCALLTAAAPAVVEAGEYRLALLVGQNDGGPRTAPLYYAEADATGVGQVLAELGGFAPGDITRLRRTSPEEVGEALSSLGRRVERIRQRDAEARVLVLFYYSGHATPEGLLLGPAQLPFRELTERVEDTGADLSLTILDSCYAGRALTNLPARPRGGASATAAVGGVEAGTDAGALAWHGPLDEGQERPKGATRGPAFELSLDAAESVRGRVVISSSSADELSQESDEIGASWFTHHLRSGLSGAADDDADGQVTLHELYGYVYGKTLLSTAGSSAGAQHASFATELSGQGELVLTTLHQAAAALHFQPQEGAELAPVLVFDAGSGRFVAEVAGTEPRTLGLPPGDYLLLRRGAEELTVAELTLAEGERVEVARLVFERRAWSADPTKDGVARLRRQGRRPRLSVAPRVGVQTALGPGSAELFPVGPSFGVELGLTDFPGRDFSLRLDISWSIRDDELQIDPYSYRYRYSQLQVGGGLYWTPRPGPVLRPVVGVRLGGVWFHRRFEDPAVAPQSYGLALPGLVLGLGFAASTNVTLGVEGRLSYLPYLVDEEDASLGLAEGVFRVEMRF